MRRPGRTRDSTATLHAVHSQPAIPNGSQLRRLPHPLHLRRTARDEGRVTPDTMRIDSATPPLCDLLFCWRTCRGSVGLAP
jgi:hypothetical protein